jgi:ParB family chromosome partitioning protein
MKQQRLGKGLGALIGEETVSQSDRGSVLEVDVNFIDPNRNQPRQKFDEEKLGELAQSIEAYGIVQPIIVQQNGDRYNIVAGERRYRAARIAGLKTVPVVVKEYSKQAFMEVSLVENLQREDLNPIEEAEAMRMLMDEHALTQEVLSSRLGKSRSAVANTLRLLSLPDEVRALVIAGQLTSGHARCLVALGNDDEKRHIARKIIEDDLSVRATEMLIKSLAERERQKKTPKKPPAPELEAAESALSTALGTRVRISGDLKKGSIQLAYYNEEQLQNLYDFLMTSQ